MRTKLTISQVAKMLKISAHTIRYYDKEGLLSSNSDPDSGYRLFDMDDVAKLSNVIILRESGIPIKEIRKLIGNYSIEAYKSQLEISYDNLMEQQRKLDLQKKVISNSLKLLESDENIIEINHRDTRYIKVVTNIPYSKTLSPIELYEYLESKNVKDIVYTNMIYQLNENDMNLSFESMDDSDTVLGKGVYLEYTFTALNDNDVTIAVMDMYAYAEKHEIDVGDSMYMSMLPHSMLIVDYGYRATLFAKINTLSEDIS